MDVMGIANLSVDMKMFQLQNAISAKVTNLVTTNVMEENFDELTQIMAALSGVGQNIDIYA